ncbi:phosphoglycerate dehydrogenase [Euzebya tangerina]|uniref:phosphoglycerate dehydrogenase n=1 Tax=Euzebya tangerina TaxID=591198 RepID=UPI00196A812D|nr:phosphoglycerate dehydrogenase [Euzebya tangerina]
MKVLVADALSDAGVDQLAERFEVDVRTGLPKPQLIEVIGSYDAVVIRSATTIDADVLEAATKLKVVARAGIGLDNVDIDAATARGVLVCNAPQSNIISAAEHAVALLLSLARRIPEADASMREGAWLRSKLKGVELAGKTVGVLGLGRIGTLVAQRLMAFGVHLVAYDPFVTTERAARLGVTLAETVLDVCEQADIITIHLPKTPETAGIIGKEELVALGPGALLVNAARGGLVDEVALHTALAEGVIRGAALDVFDNEPLGDSPLLELPNAVLTPHLGASTDEAQDKAGVQVAEAVALALDGEFVPSAVNVQIGGGIPEGVKPYMELTETLGRLFTALADGHPDGVCVEYHGRIAEEGLDALNLSALRGLLTDVVHEPVTFVNAPLIAADRDLSLSTLTNEASEDYVSLVRLRSGDNAVSGTLVGPNHRPRLVEVWGFETDMEPAAHMVFFRYTDKPGVVGTVGSKLGDAQVNIASMQVGRTNTGGEALVAMTVDSAIPPDVLDDICDAIGATAVRAVNLV